jgi:sensor domain CHASE-containing protein
MLSTVFFVVATLALGALATNVIATMKSSADIRDDERAVRAAEAALQSLKDRISSTVQDNAEWDEAYANSQQPDAFSTWAYENWGKVGADYPLYDGVVVVSGDRRIVTATLRTEDMDPAARFGSGFRRQVAQAAKPTHRPVVNFARTPFGVSLLASQAIQPHSYPAASGPHAILSFFKDIRQNELVSLEKQYQLTGLRLFTVDPPAGLLTVPLKDIGGQPIGYLGWNSLKPGTRVFEEVSGQVTAAVAILAIFVITVVASGGAGAAGFRNSRGRRTMRRRMTA